MKLIVSRVDATCGTMYCVDERNLDIACVVAPTLLQILLSLTKVSQVELRSHCKFSVETKQAFFVYDMIIWKHGPYERVDTRNLPSSIQERGKVRIKLHGREPDVTSISNFRDILFQPRWCAEGKVTKKTIKRDREDSISLIVLRLFDGFRYIDCLSGPMQASRTMLIHVGNDVLFGDAPLLKTNDDTCFGSFWLSDMAYIKKKVRHSHP